MDVQGFKDYCYGQVERDGGGMTQSTADTYIPIVERFADFIDSDEPQPGDVEDWVRYLAIERQVANSTIQKYFRAIRKYFYYKRRVGELEQVTAWVGDQYPKGGSDTPDAFSDEELEALRDAAEEDPRANVVVVLLSTLGCRVSELVQMKTTDITFIEDAEPDDAEQFPEWVEGIVTVHRNKRKEDVADDMPIGEYERDALERYLDARDEYVAPKGARSDWLFPTVYRGEAKAMTTTNVRTTILNRVAERADDISPDEVHPHKFRHTVATRLGKKSHSATQIAHYLGQKNAASADRYTHLDRSAVVGMREEVGD